MSLTSSNRTALIVLGMHRSGTSALAGVLGHLGAALPQDLMAPADMNAKGFFESNRITGLNERLLKQAGRSWWDPRPVPPAWFDGSDADALLKEAVEALEADYQDAPLFVMKDPRICRLLPFWRTALNRFGAHALVVHTHRRSLDVAASLTRWADYETEFGLLLWARHVLDAERDSRDMARSFTCYEALMDDWRNVAAGISRDLGISWPRGPEQAAAEIEEFLSRDLQHFRASPTADPDVASLPPVIAELQGMLDSWTKDAEPSKDRDRLDQMHMALEDSGPLFDPLALRTIHRAREVGHMTVRIKELQADCGRLASQFRETQAALDRTTQDRQRCDEEKDALSQRLMSMDRRLHVATVQLRQLSEQRERQIQERLRMAVALNDPTIMSDPLSALADRMESLTAQLSDAITARDQACGELSEAIMARDQARAEGKAAAEWGQRREAEFLASTSWRVTSPLRALSRTIIRLRN